MVCPPVRRLSAQWQAAGAWLQRLRRSTEGGWARRRGRSHTGRVAEAMTNAHGPALTVIGAAWCPHCKRVKKFLAAHRVAYQRRHRQHPEAIDAAQGAAGRRADHSDRRLRRRHLRGEPERRGAGRPVSASPSRRTGPPTTSSLSAADRPVWRPPSTPPVKASTPSSSTPARSAARPGSATGSTTIPGSPRASPAPSSADRFVAQARRYGVEFLPAVSVTGIEPDGEDLVTTLAPGSSSPPTR